MFHYVWPERAIDRLRQTLQQALQKLARLLLIPTPQSAVERAESEAAALVDEISKDFDQASHQAELTNFEFEESVSDDQPSLTKLQRLLSHAQRVFAPAAPLVGDAGLDEWQKLTPATQYAEGELRNAAARRIERAATTAASKDNGGDFAIALARWQRTIAHLPKTEKNRRTDLLSQIAAEVEQLG